MDKADSLIKCNSTAVYEVLDELSISYKKAEHAPVMTMADCTAIGEVLNAPFCKNLFLANRQQTEFYLLMICEEKKFKTAEVSKKIGVSRLSFGNAEALYQLLAVKPGAITAMGLIHDKEKRVRLVVDRDIMAFDRVAVHACVNTESLAIAPKDLKDIFFPFTGHEPIYIEIEGEQE